MLTGIEDIMTLLRRNFCQLIAILAVAAPLASVSSAPAQGGLAETVADADPLLPHTAVDPAAASALRRVTVHTGDMPASRRFYGDAMGMTARPNTSRDTVDFFRNVPLGDDGISPAVDVRLVAIDTAAPILRPRHDAMAIGGLAMGMPLTGQARREAIVTRAGFSSVVGITSMTLARSDGSKYAVEEIHYRAPDGVLVLGIDRGDMRPAGPIDATTGIGGPAYSSLVVDDLPASEAFMRNVLRYEMRRGFTFTSAGSKGGLGVPDGTRITLQQWYAPGAATGYVILLKLVDHPVTAAPGPQVQRGLSMWTFDVADVAAVEARARAAGARILAPLATVDGRRQTTVAMPDGFPVTFAETTRP